MDGDCRWLIFFADNKVRIAQQGGIEQLIQLLNAKNEVLHFKAVGTLSNLTFNDENKVKFARCGGIGPLIKLLSSAPEDVQKLAALILWNLALDDESKAKIGELGGIKSLIKLLSSTNEDVQKNAICVLVNLAINNSNKVRIAEEGGIEWIIKLLSSKNKYIHKNAAGALWNLALNDENQVKIASMGGIKPLIDLLWSEHSDVQIDAAGALWNLALNYDNQITIAEQGGIQALIKLLSSKSIEVQKVSAGALANISANSVLSEVLVFHDALKTISQALTQNDTHLFNQLAMILKNLAVHKPVRPKVVSKCLPTLLKVICQNTTLCNNNILPIFENIKVDDILVMTLLKSELGWTALTHEAALANTPIKAWVTAVVNKLAKKEAIYFMGTCLSSSKLRLRCNSAILISHLIHHNKYAREFRDGAIKVMVDVLSHHDDPLMFSVLHTIRLHLERALAQRSEDTKMAITHTGEGGYQLNDSRTHDIVFLVENKSIYAHQAILRKSKYFDTMFNFHEKNSVKVNRSPSLPSLNACCKSITNNTTTNTTNNGFNTTFNNFNFNGIMSFSNNFIPISQHQQHHLQSHARLSCSDDDGELHQMKKHREASQGREIKIVDVSVEVFERLLTNLYTDDVIPFHGWEDAVATLIAADRYGLHQFIEPCTLYLKDHISPSTFTQLFDINIGPDFSKMLQQECLCWLLKTCEKMGNVTEIKDFVEMEMLVTKINDFLSECL